MNTSDECAAMLLNLFVPRAGHDRKISGSGVANCISLVSNLKNSLRQKHSSVGKNISGRNNSQNRTIISP